MGEQGLLSKLGWLGAILSFLMSGLLSSVTEECANTRSEEGVTFRCRACDGHLLYCVPLS